MLCYKEIKAFIKEIATITYDNFEEYAEHLEVLENRGYKLITVTANPNNGVMLAKYERIKEIGSNK